MEMSVILMLQVFFCLCAAGAVLGMFLPDRLRPASLAWVGSVSALAALWLGGGVLLTGKAVQIPLWNLPELGMLSLQMDRLAALFLVITALVFLPVSIFSSAYLKRYWGRYSLKAFNLSFFGLFASIALILMAGDVLTFLLAWETMSILSYLLVNFDHGEEKNIRAGYLMLTMGEAGTLAAVFALLLLAVNAGSMDFTSIRIAHQGLGGGVRWAVFLLSFFGFGVKAGLVPFNAWLPRAHPAAPGNISALLSGVILNLGIYGIVRTNMDLLPVSLVWPGLAALVIGTLSAFLGILYATTENDLKVMLAHSSIENMGIVTAALGAGFVFTAAGLPVLATIAFIASLYHMTNHSLYKALLFLGAATVDAQTGTRDLDRLGGLIRRMPLTALFFLAGALSIAALPPFNGFVSEWLTLQTMLRSAELPSVGVKVVFALCGAVLALTAALAVTCFVKAFATGFLGLSRSPRAGQTGEAPRAMTTPMGLLAVFCLLLGVLPTFVIPTLNGALTPLTGTSAVDALVPPFFSSAPAHSQLPDAFAAEFRDLGAQMGESMLPGRGLVVMHRGGARNPVVFAMSPSYLFPVLLALLGLAFVGIRLGLARRRSVVHRPRWDGGIRRLLPEMTYTATGFSNPVRVIFDAIFHPTTKDTPEIASLHFRTAIYRRRQEVHIVDRWVLAPLRDGILKIAHGLAGMHHGLLNAYVAYGLLTLVIVLVVALI